MKMKQKPLKAKEVTKLIPGLELSKKDNVVLMEDENRKIITVNKEPYLFYYEDKLVPTLKLLQTKDLLKKITVDMGAIKFVVNGADIMRPGITKIQEGIEKDEFIVIVDETHQKPLAVGIALLSAEEMEKATSGKVIKNIHYVGDDLWKIE
jgi:PUA-domain protein